MLPTEARRIVEALAQGADPEMGELLLQDSDAFDQGTAVDQFAHAHGRSKGGIASRLVRLGRIYIRGAAAKQRAPS